jgi:uncharacterized membrane protein YhaH (DUF805 family)
MREFFGLLPLLKRSRYLLAAFIVPLVARSIPEILAGPYPLGLDTLRYIPVIQDGWVFTLGPIEFLKSTNMFYLFAAFANWLLNNTFAVIKVLGPLLLALLSVMVYLYAKRALKWSSRKSLLVSLLVATYFVSLRISWDLYRQTLGFIFLVAAFTVLKSSTSPRRYYLASALMVLTVLSHELAAVTLLFVVGFEAIKNLLKRQKSEFGFLSAPLALSAVLFVAKMYSTKQSAFHLPLIQLPAESSVGLAFEIFGLMLYCYALILPLAALGLMRLKDMYLRLWLILCIAVPVLTFFYPNGSLPYWNRWVYLMTYPLVFFAAEGFATLWKSWAHVKNTYRRWAPKIAAIFYLCLLLTFSGFYLTTPPEHPFSYYSQYNPYLNQIPSSMLQTTVSVTDTPGIVNCLTWLNQTASQTSVVVTHYAVHDWAAIYLDGTTTLISTPVALLGTSPQREAAFAQTMLDSARQASVNGTVNVYTIWWIPGAGWYHIPTLPSDFVEVYRSGRMAVYSYNFT